MSIRGLLHLLRVKRILLSDRNRRLLHTLLWFAIPRPTATRGYW